MISNEVLIALISIAGTLFATSLGNKSSNKNKILNDQMIYIFSPLVKELKLNYNEEFPNSLRISLFVDYAYEIVCNNYHLCSLELSEAVFRLHDLTQVINIKDDATIESQFLRLRSYIFSESKNIKKRKGFPSKSMLSSFLLMSGSDKLWSIFMVSIVPAIISLGLYIVYDSYNVIADLNPTYKKMGFFDYMIYENNILIFLLVGFAIIYLAIFYLYRRNK